MSYEKKRLIGGLHLKSNDMNNHWLSDLSSLSFSSSSSNKLEFKMRKFRCSEMIERRFNNNEKII